jgi:hypothetical protein
VFALPVRMRDESIFTRQLFRFDFPRQGPIFDPIAELAKGGRLRSTPCHTPGRPAATLYADRSIPKRWPPAVSAESLPARHESMRPLLLQVSAAEYGDGYRQHLFDQYKLAVEMADRVSARRMQANTFFLAVNTGLLTVFANLAKDKIVSGFFGALPIIALLVLCFVWWRIVRSYRQLSSGKYALILEMEMLLPSSPYAAEWRSLGEGKVPKRYLPLTHLENWVPRLFGLLDLLLLLAVLFGGQSPVALGGKTP